MAVTPFSFISDFNPILLYGITYSPVGGSYSGTSVSVTITITRATRFRWRIDLGVYTIVNSSSGVVAVPLSFSGHTLNTESLASDDTVLASHNETYIKM